MKFNIGDRVVIVDNNSYLLDHNANLKVGYTGTVEYVDENGTPPIGVVWDQEVSYSRLWYVHEDALAFEDDLLSQASVDVSDYL